MKVEFYILKYEDHQISHNDQAEIIQLWKKSVSVSDMLSRLEGHGYGSSFRSKGPLHAGVSPPRLPGGAGYRQVFQISSSSPSCFVGFYINPIVPALPDLTLCSYASLPVAGPRPQFLLWRRRWLHDKI